MTTKLFGPGAIVLGVMIAGWLVGLVAQRAIVEATNYLDISPPLILLGIGLCILGGAAARLFTGEAGRRRDGIIAGIATMASMIAGYVTLAFAYRDRFHPEEGGETWLTLLLESWFWIGVPLVVSASLGALGWLIADTLAGRGRGAPAAPR